ncbi:MAG: hypothetical protein ACREMY_03790 [bacterium]
MARDIQARLARLRRRRAGTDRLDRLGAGEQRELLEKSQRLQETWQTRSRDSYTGYALGAMQEVGADYTRICLETATRVGEQLNTRLTALGHQVAFRLQGSVPLNTHIRGVSDVDLLSLDTNYYTYDLAGARNRAGLYINPTPLTSVSVLSTLRRRAERALASAYPAATVDTSGSKAITISGGSLARPVDVVPSHWHDTSGYQASGQEKDRGVRVLDKTVPVAIDNLPFLHIHRISERDGLALGGLKKAIRLCKSIKNDVEEGEHRQIDLSSYDIASILYHANVAALLAGYTHELAILAEAQRYLDWLYHHKTDAEQLIVPDGSRRIFDTPERWASLLTLSCELDDLVKEVANELNPVGPARSMADCRNLLAIAYV